MKCFVPIEHSSTCGFSSACFGDAPKRIFESVSLGTAIGARRQRGVEWNEFTGRGLPMMNQQSRGPHSSRISLFMISLGSLGLVWACATAPDQTDWIRIGMTTRDEVVERFGQPDLVIASPEGETAIYRPPNPGQVRPRVEVPTVQAGPAGTFTTTNQPINPGPGTRAVNASTRDRPQHELRIRYDVQGIVQELLQ
jgi:hypothetical protein